MEKIKVDGIDKEGKIEKAIKLLKIEQECFRRANFCDRNCANCDLVQEDKDLIEMYEFVIDYMTQRIEP